MLLPPITIDLIEALTALRPLALATVGIAIYGIFVFNFYRFLARKDIFKLDLNKYNHTKRPVARKGFASMLYVLKFLIIFPAFVFFWFIVLAFLLSIMARNQSIDSILLAAMGVVGSIRICAYYNQTLSTDLAKILPFALLGIMLIDRTLVRFPDSSATLAEGVVEYWETMVYYMAAVVILELVMRILSGAYSLIRRRMTERGARTEGASAAAAVPADAPPDAANGNGAPHADDRAQAAAAATLAYEPRAGRSGAPAPADFPPYHPPILRDISAGGGEAAAAPSSARRGARGGMYSASIGRPTFSGRVRISGSVTNVVRDDDVTMPWERTAQWRASQESDAPTAAAPSSAADSDAGGSPVPATDRAAARRDRSFEKLAQALSYGRESGATSPVDAREREEAEAPKG